MATEETHGMIHQLFDLTTVSSTDGEALLGLMDAGAHESMNEWDHTALDDMWGALGPDQDNHDGLQDGLAGTIAFPKLVLVDGRMTLVEDRLLVLSLSLADADLSRSVAAAGAVSGSPASRSPRSHVPVANPLNLRIVKGCGRTKDDTDDYYTMPSLRLTAVEKGYTEPTRNRNKNWAIDSQREVLNKTPRHQEGPTLKKGAYPPPPLEPPPLMWAPALQSMVRRQLLLRTGWIVSDTHCIVEVFGVGVCGRVVATGQTKRMLIIEVFSTWNCKKYSMVVKVNQIKALFPGRENLFKPGKKRQLVEALLDLLYFEYQVRYPAMLIDGKPFHPPVQVLTHTERAKLPEEYPSAVCDVIRAIVDPTSWQPPELLDNESPVPILEQVLKISAVRRETAFSLRQRERAERFKQDLIDKEEERRTWNMTPKRLRGLRSVRCVRQTGKIFILQAYVNPMSSDIASLRGHAVDDSGRLRMRVSLSVAGRLAGLSSPPQRWPSATMRMATSFCLREAKLKGNFNDGYAYFDFFGRRGGGAGLMKPKHCFYRMPYYTRHNRMRLRLDMEDVKCIAGDPKEAWHPYQNTDMTSALGARSMRGKPSWKPQCKPRRDVGRGMRLVSRSRRFGDSFGIYTAYATSRAVHGDTPLSTEEAEGGGKKLNPEVAPHLAIEIEVYFPFGVSCSEVHKEVLSLPPLTTMKMTFFRSDICAMTRSLQRHHDIAFRATYLNFFDTATAVEVADAELAWILLSECILSAGCWVVQQALPPPPPPLFPELDDEATDEKKDVTGSEAADAERVVTEYDFEMDMNALGAALGDESPMKTDIKEEVLESVADVDTLAWMGGHDIENLLSQYYLLDVDDIATPYNGSVKYRRRAAIKLHIALGREAVVHLPAQSLEQYAPVLFGQEPSTSSGRPLPLITWRWSSIIYNKVRQLGSESKSRPRPILQVIQLLW